MIRRFNQVLLRLRVPIVALALLFILYCNAYMWFYVPPDDYEFTWSPDTQLRILSLPAESLARPYLQPDDSVIAIGGRSVKRMAVLYPLPLRTNYEFTVQRGDAILTYNIPVPTALTALALKNQLPTTILSLAGWAVGALLLLFARRENIQAIHAGYIFLLGPVVLVGIQAAQDGTPYAWTGGQALVFLLAAAWPYLGLIPREQELSPLSTRGLLLLVGVAVGLALLAVYEVLILFPHGLSVEELYGISMYSAGFLLSGVGLVAFVLLLGWRTFTLPQDSYLRQQLLILLVFVGIGVFPIVFLTILPRVLLDTVFLPFPIAIALMLFIPAGYLFVIYRRGFLGLDPLFGRSIYLTLLSLLVFVFYAGGLYSVQRILNLNGPEAVLPATVVFFPTLLLTIYLNRPVNRFVQQLIYGKIVLNQETLADYALALSARPEIATLDHIIASLADVLNSSSALLALKDKDGHFVQISAKGSPVTGAVSRVQIPEFHEPVVRATLLQDEEPPALALFQWAELAVPLKAREEQIGILFLSRPGPDGYFNAKQVMFLKQAASMLAVASENISLFEVTRSLSMQALVVQEKERQRLALEIHDAPLQEITFVTNTIDHLIFKMGTMFPVGDDPMGENLARVLSEANGHLRTAATALRNICLGLYPPFRDQGMQLTVQEIAREFEEKHGLDITLILDHYPQSADVHSNDASAIAVSRILSEALKNVVKHAPDASVWVQLDAGEENLYLSVADNGPGVRDLSLSELIRQKHLGIVGMHEAARYAGGHLKLRASKPHGLEVFFTCPLPPHSLA